MKQYHSRSLLFLSELVVGVLIFAVVATVCAVFFVQAYQISRQTATLNQAIITTQNVAEAFHARTPADFLAQLNPDYQQTDNQFYLYFDRDFAPCRQEEQVYTLTATVEGAGSIRTVDITTKENDEAVYSLETTAFCSGEASV